ncbi:helix-turn-helix transcriptional regulator [Nocardia sp. 2]|uniref:Helix-turn-helix transcriptional regulator n=1 Tax=Nocardia acididurans TaxID=2802282 RepID=A0ABS1M9P0_9NOCA|nr:helix-turn-helix transcriptional regulator [Nocardia acididurans]MBL1076855.1 helix-turn-helix transcriptional regulator [Nocardia acididurans]
MTRVTLAPPREQERRTRAPHSRRFAARLDWLLNYGAAQAPLTTLQVVADLAAQGHSVSPGYLSQLRTGVRPAPSNALVTALARYFEVDEEYFYAPSPTTEHHDRAVAELFAHPRLRRLLSAACDLSAESQELLAEVAGRLYAGEYDTTATAATA